MAVEVHVYSEAYRLNYRTQAYSNKNSFLFCASTLGEMNFIKRHLNCSQQPKTGSKDLNFLPERGILLLNIFQ